MADRQPSILMAGLICMLMAGCTASAADTPAPTGAVSTQAAGSATDSASETSMPRLTRTPRPTRTPQPTTTPSATPTATPDVPLAPDGPWLVFIAPSVHGDDSNLWATNSDGTGFTALIDENILAYAIQPGRSLKEGVLIAYITQSDFEARDMTLKLLHLPDRQVQSVATLINDRDAQQPIESYNAWSAAQEGGLVWSPDGQQLAFVAQIDGPTMDVYRYDLETESIHWLSSGATQAFRLMWSPDQRWIVHQGFMFIGMGGPEVSGVWAADTDGRGATVLFDADEEPAQMAVRLTFYGWLDDYHVLLTNWQYEGDSAIQAVDIRTGEAETVLKAPFGMAAPSPTHDAWLLTSPYEQRETVPLRLWRSGNLTDIPGYALTQIGWSDLFGEFTGFAEDGQSYTVSLSGQVDEMPVPAVSYIAPEISPSPDGDVWAWYVYKIRSSGPDLWIGEPRVTPSRIEEGRPGMIFGPMTWSPDSRRLLVFAEKGLWAAERPDFELVQVVDGSYVEYWSGYDLKWIE